MTKSLWEIGVSWKKTDAKSYNVYRSNSKNGNYRKIATVKTNTYSDNGVEPGNKYYYKITSVDGKKDSKFSKTASAMASSAAPENVKAVKEKAGTAKITWSEAMSANGYTVYMSESKDGEYKSIGSVANKNDPSLKKRELEKGKTYYFKVRSYYLDKNGKKIAGGTSEIVSVKV